MTGRHRAIGIAMALGATVGLVWVSTAQLTSHESEGVLRLTWSARPERIETCRPQTEEELAKLPAHMRQRVVCTGESATYRLQVRRNGRVLLDETVHGGGWRRDRPLYVFHELSQPPGVADISVMFDRLGALPAQSAASEVSPEGRFISDLPATLRLEETFRFRPGAVVLVTYDSRRRVLTAVPPESH